LAQDSSCGRKVPFPPPPIAMQFSLVTSAIVASWLPVAVEAVRANHGSSVNQSSCLARDEAQRVMLQAKLVAFGVVCEEMCQRTGQYPNCQCPGFAGNAASDDDSRKCIDKYCQDPSTPCPNDNFVMCVKENTKVSVLQWDALLQRMGASLSFGSKAVRAKPIAIAGSCETQDKLHRAFLQAKLTAFGPDCEDMCKRLDKYPNCQCPGFEGNPASDGDSRKCMELYCQDPSTPCPNDNFVICVKENTKVSVLQWADLFQRLDASVALWNQTMAANTTSKTAAKAAAK